MKNTKQHLLAVALAFPALACAAFGNGEWEDRKKVNFDTAAPGVELKEAVALLPVPVRLHTGNLDFSKVKADGSDLRAVAADDKTPLKQTLEFLDPANELGLIWVQLPRLAPGEKEAHAWLYHGNPKASPAEGKGAFDGYSVVYHFGEDGAAKDASGNGNHAGETTAKPGRLTHLGWGVGFTGSERIFVPASPTLRVSAAASFTYSAWIKPTAGDGSLYKQKDGTGALSIDLEGGMLSASVGGSRIKAGKPLAMDSWQLVAMSWGGGKATLYVDGAEVASGAAAVADLGGDVVIGDGFRGEMDEVAVAPLLRSAEFLRLQFIAQQPDSPLVVLGEPEGDEEGGHSTFGILLKALTPDALVVIIILGIMGVISFAVMAAKTSLLLRVEKSNDRFLDRFRNDGDSLLTATPHASSSLADDASIRQSPIYKLYEIGINEMRKRLAGGRTRLSGASLDAMRASIDATLVRENHKLNARIVLLTIAISGGPFLGLLGTVVGVMITFAEIAAAGDVNVNAIAPGIAAALVATVAGLAVAIPSLFGYNWLASRIKNISADMQVFADEFITRAAEMYSE